MEWPLVDNVAELGQANVSFLFSGQSHIAVWIIHCHVAMDGQIFPQPLMVVDYKFQMSQVIGADNGQT